jgi:hypothetical protein
LVFFDELNADKNKEFSFTIRELTLARMASSIIVMYTFAALFTFAIICVATWAIETRKR